MNKPKNLLFIDFNGVISMDNFWHTLTHPNHELHEFHSKIENFLFKENIQIIQNWMVGKYSYKDIHFLLEKEIGLPADKLL